jgi:hypothetical protein
MTKAVTVAFFIGDYSSESPTFYPIVSLSTERNTIQSAAGLGRECVVLRLLGVLTLLLLAGCSIQMPQMFGAETPTQVAAPAMAVECTKPGSIYGAFSVITKTALWQRRKVRLAIVFQNVGSAPASVIGGDPVTASGLATFTLTNAQGAVYTNDPEARLPMWESQSVSPGSTVAVPLTFGAPKGSYTLTISRPGAPTYACNMSV